jgi:hypothetical protein
LAMKKFLRLTPPELLRERQRRLSGSDRGAPIRIGRDGTPSLRA